MKFIWRLYWILKRKVYLAKMNNLPKHHSAGPQKCGAQCSCIGCIGLRPALPDVTISCEVLVVIMRVSVLDQTKRCCPLGLDHGTVNRCNYCKAIIAKLQSSSTVQAAFAWYFVENIFPKWRAFYSAKVCRPAATNVAPAGTRSPARTM